MLLWWVVWVGLTFVVTQSTIIPITKHGALPNKNTTDIAIQNTFAITWSLGNATSGDTVLVPLGQFYLVGGVTATGLSNIVFQIDGQLIALRDAYDVWPHQGGDYEHLVQISNSDHITVTSGQSRGVIEGNGLGWWNRELLNQLKYKRPKLLVIEHSKDVLVEKLHLHNSPSFHLLLGDVLHGEVRFVDVEVDRKEQRALKATHRRGMTASRQQPPLEPEDLNTDGIDPSGRNIYIHDCTVYNDDDSIAVKPCNTAGCPVAGCTENVLLERLTLAGFGASIGSVPPKTPVNCVRNITFRNITMPRTGKGIYIKSNPECGGSKRSFIEHILYEDINIIDPLWWSIWIGPQQQHEPHSALGRKCALDWPIDPHCPTQGCTDFRNITLRRVRITNPLMSPGVIMGNGTNPMQGIVFEDVVVTGGTTFPFGHNYFCTNASITIKGSTNPVPRCT